MSFRVSSNWRRSQLRQRNLRFRERSYAVSDFSNDQFELCKIYEIKPLLCKTVPHCLFSYEAHELLKIVLRPTNEAASKRIAFILDFPTTNKQDEAVFPMKDFFILEDSRRDASSDSPAGFEKSLGMFSVLLTRGRIGKSVCRTDFSIRPKKAIQFDAAWPNARHRVPSDNQRRTQTKTRAV